MGRIQKLLENCQSCDPIKVEDTYEVLVEHTQAMGIYVIDVGVELNSNRFEAIKNKILSKQANGIKINVFQVGPRQIEFRLDSPEMSEKVKTMSEMTVGEIETMLGELKQMVERKVVAVIKPTKNNKAALKKRGLGSNDSQRFFNLYNAVLSDKEFELDTNDKFDKMILDDLEKSGIKF